MIDFNNNFFCIVDRDKPVLAAVISSYVNNPNEYLPLFEYSSVPISKNETDTDLLKVNVITKTRAENFNIRVSNTLQSKEKTEYLILGGLDENQKSYLTFLENYNVIEIDNYSDVDFLLKSIIDKTEYFACTEENIYPALFYALKNNLLLTINKQVTEIPLDKVVADGVVVIECKNVVSTVIAINYAQSFNLDIELITPPIVDLSEIQFQISQWKNLNNEQFFLDLSAKIYPTIENINFKKYKFATFFTFGVPYSLILKNIISITHVNTYLKPDFFVFINIKKEISNCKYSAIVFSPLEFGNDEETMFILEKLKQYNYFTKGLIGKEASVFNLENYIPEYPYEILHICSHGGEVKGFTLIEEFVDSHGDKHIVEYDEVVSFAPDKSEELISVTTTHFFRKFNGFQWKSKELEEQGYPHYVFADMVSELFKLKEKSRKLKSKIEGSCAIKCSDFHYQAMFDIISGDLVNPFVFNNTCWSWIDIAESFLHSGASSYIGTLWNINNDIAKLCAETFYDNLNENTILEAYQKAISCTIGYKDEDIYIFWGLHFSTIKKGNSIIESKKNVTQSLLDSLYSWQDQLVKEKNEKVKEKINRTIKWNYNQLRDLFLN